MLTVFGTYTSLNNETRFGLSRIIIDDLLSTNDLTSTEENIKIYPNPTNDIINIAVKNEVITQTNVYDMYGRLLMSKKATSENEKISIQDLPNAIYLIEVKTDNGTKTMKIIKQ